MKPDTTVKLGDFVFSDAEVPESISFGGSQRTAVHELVGGTRIIDCLGRADSELPWSGIFTGLAAVDRAKYLDTLRIRGTAQDLTWGEFSYSVLVSDFKADYRRAYRIPYHITCQVIADLANPTTTLTPPSIDVAINLDQASAASLGLSINDSLLTALLNALDTAIGAVSSFANAAQSVINSVLQPLAAVQARVALLIRVSGSVLANVTTFGGIVPYAPPGVNAASLSNQVENLEMWEALFQLEACLARMATNLSTVETAPNVITVAGGNLFQIAEAQYGDAMAWTGIAIANGLTDPFLEGTVTLFIPSLPDSSGGVLGA
jgi:hypothetical protein